MIRNKLNSDGNGGFTIVELLVVIVVIGILAAITIVSYTGITARANLSKAQGNANSVQSVIESMNADNGTYPKTATSLMAGSQTTKVPSGVTLLTGTATLATNKDPKEVLVQICGATSPIGTGNALGGRIQYWDSVTGAVSTNIIYFGTGSATTGTATCNAWETIAA